MFRSFFKPWTHRKVLHVQRVQRDWTQDRQVFDDDNNMGLRFCDASVVEKKMAWVDRRARATDDWSKLTLKTNVSKGFESKAWKANQTKNVFGVYFFGSSYHFTTVDLTKKFTYRGRRWRHLENLVFQEVKRWPLLKKKRRKKGMKIPKWWKKKNSHILLLRPKLHQHTLFVNILTFQTLSQLSFFFVDDGRQNRKQREFADGEIFTGIYWRNWEWRRGIHLHN